MSTNLFYYLLSIANKIYVICILKLYILNFGDAMRIEYLIKEIRTRQGLTLRELSRRTGISNGYLSEIENGQKNPSFFNMVIISKALKVQLEELYRIIN